MENCSRERGIHFHGQLEDFQQSRQTFASDWHELKQSKSTELFKTYFEFLKIHQSSNASRFALAGLLLTYFQPVEDAMNTCVRSFTGPEGTLASLEPEDMSIQTRITTDVQ